MKRIFAFVVTSCLFVLCAPVQAATCAPPSGSSGAAVYAAAVTAGAGACTDSQPFTVGVSTSGVPSTLTPIAATNVVMLAGTYNVSSQLSLPCGPQRYAIVSTPSSLGGSAKATSLNWVGGGNTNVVQINSCGGQELWIQNVEINGNRPSPGGGGGIRVAPGASHFHVINDFIHGMQGDPRNSGNPDNGEGSVYFAGCAQNSPGCNYQTSVDTHVDWNQLGHPITLDCSNLMGSLNYGGTNYDATGGTCGSYGVHSGIQDSTFSFNRITNVEQALKGYDAGTNGRCFQNGVSGCVVYSFFYTNWRVASNHMTGIHRNAMETQSRAQGNPGYVTQYNDLYDMYNQSYTGMGLSLPSCCGHGPNYTTVLDNVIIANPNASTPANAFRSEALEWWSDGHADHNLIQGYWGFHSNGVGAAIQWGANVNHAWTANYNFIQIANNPCCGAAGIHQEEPWNASGPQQIGNVTQITTNFTPLVSMAPTLTAIHNGPNGPFSLILSDQGLGETTAGARGNTSIYYTTDGTQPTMASPSCYQTCTIDVTAIKVVNARGMWGAPNQPTAYPAGFGFVPSAVVTWSMGGPVIPPVVIPPVVIPPVIIPPTPVVTLAGATLAAPKDQNTAVVGDTIAFSVIGVNNDGTPAKVDPALISWASSDATVMTIAPSGIATMVGPGKANVQAKIGSVTSAMWGVTVSVNPLIPPINPPPLVTIISASLQATNNASTMVAGRGLQFSAFGTYTDKSISPVSNGKISWGTSDHTVLTISTTGRATAVGAGMANVTASIGSLPAVMYAVKVLADTGQPFTVNMSLVPGVYTVTVGTDGTATIAPQK